VNLDNKGIERAVAVSNGDADVIHIVADSNGNEIGTDKPMFVKDMIRKIHKEILEKGWRDDVTSSPEAAFALAEHMAKGLLCGADLVSIELPLLVGLECRLCSVCREGHACPAKSGKSISITASDE
jgi:hypothetical protein